MTIREVMRLMGKKGGSVRSPAKRAGKDSEWGRRLVAKRWAKAAARRVAS